MVFAGQPPSSGPGQRQTSSGSLVASLLVDQLLSMIRTEVQAGSTLREQHQQPSIDPSQPTVQHPARYVHANIGLNTCFTCSGVEYMPYM